VAVSKILVSHWTDNPVKYPLFMVMVKQNEVLLKHKDEWLYFSEPHEILAVSKLEEVPKALNEVERLVEKRGWHAAGFLSYEAAPAFDPALLTHAGDEFPYLWFGLYPQPRAVFLPPPDSPKIDLDWQPIVDRYSYEAAIERIKEYIARGRTYQVNYTMRLQATFDASPSEFFRQLTQTQNQHAAYVDTGRYVICSASPESFFALDGETITCRPMKGTAKRGRTTEEDQAQAAWLRNSEKNRAENVMIVDMIRNDLGRIAKTGSVHVPELFRVERYPTLWQMTSTVTARTNASLSKIFASLFPCASITGAPKVSTMKIIHELETTPRRIYTGAIGHFSPGRKASFNVAIRTALIDCQARQAEYGIGGGIVWDSTSTDEYAEALLKARILTEESLEFSLLETMLWTPEDGFYLQSRHMDRLLDSAAYFDFPVSKAAIEENLARLTGTLEQPHRVRLLLDREGKIEVTGIPISYEMKPISAALAKEPVSSNDIFLFHKTTRRDVYDLARTAHPGCDDVLLHNERGELTEFTIGNLVVELDGELVTPPVACGLLAGTFRAELLETGRITERVIPLHRLKECTKIYRVNSVRKWEEVIIL
jgi:para-aminobenzoate synthetase/4-amino-4-deoxychorismate lyase